MIKTITINTETHKVVPIEPTVEFFKLANIADNESWSGSCCSADNEAIYHCVIESAPEFNESQNFLTYEDWWEDDGDVIWYKFPVDEPPYIGSPLNSDWIEGYYTHWVPLPF